MSVSRHFAATYAEARQRFHDACDALGLAWCRYDNPVPGPDGEALTTDVVRLGPAAGDKVLITVSATHGVEGFCGSGCQVAWMLESGPAALPDGVAMLVIHAHNPYGFAWLRRTNEDNIDLNRNYVDFAAALPRNDPYDELAEAICPAEWSGPAREAAEARLAAYAVANGPRALQAAITQGQYKHADGLFYGGQAPSWSRRTLEAVVLEACGAADHVGMVDYHTGLGPYGHGEIISGHGGDEGSYKRAAQWYGADEVTSSQDGTSSSAPIVGNCASALVRLLPRAVVTGVALEFGTRPVDVVLAALRADAWLHSHGDPESDAGRAIKAQVRDAFYPDADDWKAMVVERSDWVVERALTALAAA